MNNYLKINQRQLCATSLWYGAARAFMPALGLSYPCELTDEAVVVKLLACIHNGHDNDGCGDCPPSAARAFAS